MADDNQHHAVSHPFKNLKTTSDRFINWVANRLLASPFMFYMALIAPLVVLPMSDSVKLLLAVISSNWIQWWALPALQRNQNQKADSDHEALTYIATKTDRIESILLHPSSQKAANDQ
jgi:hypothetical protein